MSFIRPAWVVLAAIVLLPLAAVSQDSIAAIDEGRSDSAEIHYFPEQAQESPLPNSNDYLATKSRPGRIQPQKKTEPCIRILWPVPGQFITDTACTVSVEASCVVRRIVFHASYLSADKRNIEVIKLGTASQSPYQIEWKVASIPNQLFDGAEIRATALLVDSSIQEARAQGIFIFHGKATAPRVKIPFRADETASPREPLLFLASRDSTVRAEAFLSWNDSGIFFSVKVTDPFFLPDSFADAASPRGIEILLDPAFSSAAFPTKQAYVAAFPSIGDPFRVVYSHAADSQGAFRVVKTSAPVSHRCSLQRTADGYVMQGRLPTAIFGGKLPDSTGFNLIIKYVDSSSVVRELSWVTASGNEAYSPCMWGRLVMAPRAAVAKAILGFCISATVGFLAVFLTAGTVLGVNRTPTAPTTPPGIKGRRDIDEILGALDLRITETGLSLRSFAESRNLSPRKLQAQMKKAVGMPFDKYLAYARVELAKERLRSSRTSETFIAESCGFRDARQMKKCFQAICRMTPARYRSHFHVD